MWFGGHFLTFLASLRRSISALSTLLLASSLSSLSDPESESDDNDPDDDDDDVVVVEADDDSVSDPDLGRMAWPCPSS